MKYDELYRLLFELQKKFLIIQKSRKLSLEKFNFHLAMLENTN